MESEHVMSKEAMDEMQTALSKNEKWMAYNTMCYFLEKDDVRFFDNSDEAEEFATNNISDPDSFGVIKISSVQDALRQLPYGKLIDSSFQTRHQINNELKAAALNDLEQLSNKNLMTNKNFFMNEKNHEYLIEQLKRTGFGDALNNQLHEKMDRQDAEFTLNLETAYGTDKVTATLHFKKSEQTDMFFFNKYELQLKKENSKNTVQVTFYPNRGITLKEGYNMLDGRAVHKTLTNKQEEKYNAWLQLDFKNLTPSGNYEIKQFHQNYGFDLESTLAKYPIKELENEKYKESLIKSLERRNLQSATFVLNGKEEKIYITPNLIFKTLNAYNSGMQKISLTALIQKNKQEATSKQEAKEEVSEKQQLKKQSKINKEENGPGRKMRKKQKIS